MFKRSITIVMLIVLVLTFPVAALADSIAVPESNSFFMRNMENCVYMGRYFYANGEGGYVSLRSEPGSQFRGYRVENGSVLYIIYTFNSRGEIWGITEIYEEGKQRSQWQNGWVLMSELLLQYDHISFAEDYGDEFYIYSGDFASLYPKTDIVFWEWPGSGVIESILESQWRSNEEHETIFLTPEKSAYRDADGREWVYIPYLFGQRAAWICLDEPASRDIPVFFPAPQPELWQPGPSQLVEYEARLNFPALIVAMVAAIVVITIVLISLFRRRKRS